MQWFSSSSSRDNININFVLYTNFPIIELMKGEDYYKGKVMRWEEEWSGFGVLLQMTLLSQVVSNDYPSTTLQQQQ